MDLCYWPPRVVEHGMSPRTTLVPLRGAIGGSPEGDSLGEAIRQARRDGLTRDRDARAYRRTPG